MAEISEQLEGQEIHHHDVIHFALAEIKEQIEAGDGEEILKRMRKHLRDIQDRRLSLTPTERDALKDGQK